jgi:hypothetical protein
METHENVVLYFSLTDALLYKLTTRSSKPEFVNLLRSPEIDFLPGWPVRQPYLTYRPAIQGYIGWRNRFLGTGSWAP